MTTRTPRSARAGEADDLRRARGAGEADDAEEGRGKRQVPEGGRVRAVSHAAPACATYCTYPCALVPRPLLTPRLPRCRACCFAAARHRPVQPVQPGARGGPPGRGGQGG